MKAVCPLSNKVKELASCGFTGAEHQGFPTHGRRRPGAAHGVTGARLHHRGRWPPAGRGGNDKKVAWGVSIDFYLYHAIFTLFHSLPIFFIVSLVSLCVTPAYCWCSTCFLPYKNYLLIPSGLHQDSVRTQAGGSHRQQQRHEWLRWRWKTPQRRNARRQRLEQLHVRRQTNNFTIVSWWDWTWYLLYFLRFIYLLNYIHTHPFFNVLAHVSRRHFN